MKHNIIFFYLFKFNVSRGNVVVNNGRSQPKASFDAISFDKFLCIIYVILHLSIRFRI